MLGNAAAQLKKLKSPRIAAFPNRLFGSSGFTPPILSRGGHLQAIVGSSCWPIGI
jgi:hypothetical protein